MAASLSSDIWAEIIHYLPPEDISIVVSSSLLPSSPLEIAERASWLALTTRLRHAICKVKISSQCVSFENATQFDLLAKYTNDDDSDNQETFLGLYRLFLAVRRVELHGRVFRDRIVAKLGTNGLDRVADNAALWLLFGTAQLSVEVQPHHPELEKERDLILIYYNDMARVIAFSLPEKMAGITAGDGSFPQRGLSPTRILQIVLRLGDAGNWGAASNILNTTEESFSRQGSEMNTDVKICASKFRIDRMYAMTYVSDSNQNSKDIIDAVVMAREAVQKSLQMMTETTSHDIDKHPPPGVQDADRSTVSSKSSEPPAALKSLFASPRLRLAAARLALARALGSLGQHVGLGATDTARFRIPLAGNAIGGDNTDGRVMARFLFEEGLEVIRSSLAELGGDAMDLQSGSGIGHGPRDDIDMDILEVRAATIAARGELMYCATSANTRGRIQIRDNNEVLSMETMLQKSIESLKESFIHAGGSVAIKLKDHGISVGAWCNHAPRSLMLLQCQTAKDLGKVCNFAHAMRRVIGSIAGGTDEEANRFLTFALAVSLRLCGKSHPSTVNIQRLGEDVFDQRDDPSVIDETKVNEWLFSVFGNSTI